MDDLLKEAIADAKAVRETALENAKIALEEAFTPRLQSMLSKKIQSEIDVEEGAHEDEEEEKVDENDVSSGIGAGDNKVDKKAGDSTDIGKAGSAKFESVNEGAHEDEDEVEEDIDLEEIVKALTEEDDDEEEKNEVSKLQSELDEHRNVVKYLRSKLNEVNLLNAKLLFTNKLFRSFGLNNDQKMKVVETFDRAHNLREVKLVYSTLAESFGNNKKTEIKESKGSASKPVASTKSEKQEVISEGHELRDRFKKLAGIL